MNKKISIVVFIVMAVIIFAIMFIIFGSGKSSSEATAKIGYIMTGSSEDSGWNGMHYQGVKQACENLGASLLLRENVMENTGACREAVESLIEEGTTMIILSSYNYSAEVLDLIKEHSEISFYSNSFEHHEKNLSSYFVRMYQARYLAGIVAGMESKTGEIGYVAAMSNSEVNRGISAFTLGAHSVNPEARVWVKWTGTWQEKEAEQKAAKELIDGTNIDVITYHQNLPYVVEIAEAAGIKSIGYHVAEQGFSDNYMTAVVCDWEQTYEAIIREFLQGKANSVPNYWIGMEEGVVKLSPFSDAVSKEVQEKVEEVENRINNGWNIFSGYLVDTDGVIRCNEDENLSDEQLLEHFDWLVEGVEIYE